MSTNSQTNEGNPGLSKAQREKMKKLAVFSLMSIICAGCLWLIFSPSAKEKAKQDAQSGFNTEIPDPKSEGIIGDKRDAYEQEQLRQKQMEKMRSLEDFSAMLGDVSNAPKPADDLTLLTSNPAKEMEPQQSRPQSSIQSSAMVYRDMNRTLGGFYETPKDDPEKERLKQELEDLKNRMDESENSKNAVDNQLSLMEKSFQMAAKYMPGTAGTNGTVGTMGTVGATSGEPAPTGSGRVSGKPLVTPVTQVRTQVVSVLQSEMSGAEFIETYSQPRNMSFLTATAETTAGTKNTVMACVYSNQTVMSGQNVRLRLLEAVQIGRMTIPRHTLLSGMAKIQGERLSIAVNSIEHEGTIVPVELSIYDTDGQQGIFIPDLQELNAAKEVVANMGTNAGTSINLSNDAGKQFAADMGRNLIQGVSQFSAKKLREVKVHLKVGYRVYLVSEELLKIDN